MEYTYSAFISYRHMPADIAAAKAVQRALETYRIPDDVKKKTGVTKLKRCFRDQDEMPLADDLGSSIEKALQESQWLLVICTPDLPHSQWCLKEVEYFIQLGRKDNIIPVLVTGEPKDSFPQQLLWRETESGREELEPLAADLRGNMARQLKTEKLRIVARMLNLNYNDLKKRERERALRTGLIAVSGVLAVALCFAGYALHQNRLLTEERNQTARNATQLLIEKSVRSTTDRDLGSGLAYALQAYEGSRMFGDEYDEAIGAALEAAMYPENFSQIGSLRDDGIVHRGARLSNDGKYITCRESNNSLQVYSSVTGERLYILRDFGWFGNTALDITPDSKYICQFADGTVTLYDIADGTKHTSKALPAGWYAAGTKWSVVSSLLTVNNKMPVYQPETGKAGLFDTFTGKVAVLDGVLLEGSANTVVVHRSGRRLAWTDDARTWIVDGESETVVTTLESELFFGMGGPISGEYTRDGWYYVYFTGEEYVYCRWDTMEEVCRSSMRGALSPDGTMLAVANNDIENFTIWSTQTGEELWTEGHNSGNTIYGLAFVDDDTLIASHEEFQIYRIHDRATVYDSGQDRTTYGYDYAAGRLVMPLRAGGCLVNLLPEEDNDGFPHMTVERRSSYDQEELAGQTLMRGLMGTWEYNTYSAYVDGQWVTVESDEPGLFYEYDGELYVIHPVNGVVAPVIYVSPDGRWQVLIRDDSLDIFRAQEGPEPLRSIPGNGYQRFCAAISGDVLAVGSYVENLMFYDLNTGECLAGVDTGAMCANIQFSADGKYFIAFSGMAEQVTVGSMQNFAPVMKIPVENVLEVYNDLVVGFNKDGTEAVVLYPDGHADVGLLYQDLDTLVEKAKGYTK